MGYKAGAEWVAPLCASCHATLHGQGQQTFERAHGIDLAHWAAIIDARYDAYVAEAER